MDLFLILFFLTIFNIDLSHSRSKSIVTVSGNSTLCTVKDNYYVGLNTQDLQGSVNVQPGGTKGGESNLCACQSSSTEPNGTFYNKCGMNATYTRTNTSSTFPANFLSGFCSNIRFGGCGNTSATNTVVWSHLSCGNNINSLCNTARCKCDPTKDSYRYDYQQAGSSSNRCFECKCEQFGRNYMNQPLANQYGWNCGTSWGSSSTTNATARMESYMKTRKECIARTGLRCLNGWAVNDTHPIWKISDILGRDMGYKGRNWCGAFHTILVKDEKKICHDFVKNQKFGRVNYKKTYTGYSTKDNHETYLPYYLGGSGCYKATYTLPFYSYDCVTDKWVIDNHEFTSYAYLCNNKAGCNNVTRAYTVTNCKDSPKLKKYYEMLYGEFGGFGFNDDMNSLGKPWYMIVYSNDATKRTRLSKYFTKCNLTNAAKDNYNICDKMHKMAYSYDLECRWRKMLSMSLDHTKKELLELILLDEKQYNATAMNIRSLADPHNSKFNDWVKFYNLKMNCGVKEIKCDINPNVKTDLVSERGAAVAPTRAPKPAKSKAIRMKIIVFIFIFFAIFLLY